jgi:hypothetical protein
MTTDYTTKPLYYSGYSFIAKVNGKTMAFASEKEYEEYIESDVQIIKRTITEHKQFYFHSKLVFYKRKSNDTYYVYKASQYFNHKPLTDVYRFKDYWEAFRKYKELGGK